MKSKASHKKAVRSALTIVLSLLIACLAAGPVIAAGDVQGQARNRKQVQSAAQEPQGEALRQRIQQRIQNDGGLQEQERSLLQSNLKECVRLGLDDAIVTALFSDKTALRAQIRTQEIVLTLAREGEPIEPVVQKLQEGLRKGAAQDVRERVCAQVAEQVREAYSYMKQARGAGVRPGDAAAEQKRVREMASYMWRGLKQNDMAELQKRARERMRGGSCTTEDLTAAAEAATRLTESGVQHDRAMRLAGDALQNGYTAREMRQLVWAVMTARTHGGSPEKVIGTLERGIRNQYQFSRMMQEMQQQGWMGPADQQGGHSPIDNAGGSGYGGHGAGSGSGGSGGAAGTSGRGGEQTGGRGTGGMGK